MVQVALSEEELIDLDMAIRGTLVKCQMALRVGKGNTKLLVESVKRLAALHEKLHSLIENMGEE